MTHHFSLEGKRMLSLLGQSNASCADRLACPSNWDVKSVMIVKGDNVVTLVLGL